MSTVLVAGATGYIGFGVALAFRRKGWKVYGTVRTEDAANRLREYEIIPVLVDLVKSVTPLGEVLHDASVVVDAHMSEGFSHDPNRKLLDELATHATAHSRKTYIMCSGILVNGHHPYVVDEGTEIKPTAFMTGRVKFEQYVLEHPKVIGIVLRPGYVYGGDSGKYISGWWKPDDQPLRSDPNISWSWVHVDDCAEAFVKAAQRRASLKGEVFNIADVSHTYAEVRIGMARAGGYQGKLTFTPLTSEDLAGWSGTMFQNVVVSSTKAREVLGWKPRHAPFLSELAVHYQAFLAAQKKKK